MKFKMVVADFDGTLGVAPDIVEPSTVEVVKEYQKKGGKFVICTGRMLESIIKICKKYGFSGDVIAYQGAVVADAETGKASYVSGIDCALAAEIAKDLINNKELVLVDVNDKLYYSDKNKFTDIYEINTVVKGSKIDDLPAFILKNNAKVQKIMIMTEDEKKSELMAKYSAKYKDVLINSGSPFLIEIVNPKCSKGYTVNLLAKRYGIDIKDVMSIGDSTNDKSLIEMSGHGVAVGDGAEELKAVAKEVTVPFKEKPVEYLLKKYCL